MNSDLGAGHLKKFALIGAAGYIAPRHMQAIKDTGNSVEAALDPSDSVGIIDSYFPQAHFFTEFERFDRHIDKMSRKGCSLDYLSICSPNYLHDSHVRFGLRSGMNVICEKPLVLNPWNLDALAKFENETEKKVSTILQLRLHPTIKALKSEIRKVNSPKKFEVELSYITSRGRWYLNSWKGETSKSGGIATNIGIHFFDMLSFLFGKLQEIEVHYSEPDKSSGFLEYELARVKWYLSIDSSDLKYVNCAMDSRTYRSVIIDGNEVEFSTGFSDLHTESYRQILAGDRFGIEDARASIEATSQIRNTKVIKSLVDYHPILKKSLKL